MTYCDEVIETMPRPALANLQEHLLLRLVPFVYERSGLVREQWDAVGLSAASIRSLDDFRAKVPFLNKDMLRSYRDRTGDPFGGTRCEGQPRLRSVGFTSGTTGDPTAIPFSDQIASNRGLKRDLWHIGLRPGDYFIYNILTIRRGQESDRFADVGFRPICLGHGTNELGRLLEACEAFRPKVLHHLSRPLIAALEELDSLGKVDLKSVFTSCVGAVFGGEPPGPKAVRLVRSWGFELFDFTSLGDVCTAMECRAHDGMHAWEDLAFVECIDPDSDEPVLEGAPGELVVTSLQDEIAPLVRFRSGDLVTYTSDGCRCGRTHGRIKVLGRVADQVIVDGRSIMPRDIMPILDHIPEIAGGLFQIIRPQRELRELRLRVGLKPHVNFTAGVGDQICRLVTQALEVPTSVEVLSAVELQKLGPPHKIPRVVPR